MTLCYEVTTNPIKFETQRLAVADFLNKVLWRGRCYQMGACPSGDIFCAEPGFGHSPYPVQSPLTISSSGSGSITGSGTTTTTLITAEDIAEAKHAGPDCRAVTEVMVTTSPGIMEKSCADGSVWDQQADGTWKLWAKGAKP